MLAKKPPVTLSILVSVALWTWNFDSTIKNSMDKLEKSKNCYKFSSYLPKKTPKAKKLSRILKRNIFFITDVLNGKDTSFYSEN